MMMYTGCPTTGRGGCPLFPECKMIVSDNPRQLKTADVVVVYQKEPRKIDDAPWDPKTRKPYRVILWKEALWRAPNELFQRDLLDFEIGTHHTAGILNPHWFLPPSDLLSGRLFTSEKIPFLPLEERRGFAMSIISHCEAPSMRDQYLRHLIRALGATKVHRYGECGNRKLPPRPISNAAKLIANYKL